MDKPLWDPSHPRGKDLLMDQPDLIRRLNKGLPTLRNMDPIDLWASLQSYDVIDGVKLERCKSERTSAEQVERLVRYLKEEVVWKTHGFFRALADIGKDAYIDKVLGKDASIIYNGSFNNTGGKQTHGQRAVAGPDRAEDPGPRGLCGPIDSDGNIHDVRYGIIKPGYNYKVKY